MPSGKSRKFSIKLPQRNKLPKTEEMVMVALNDLDTPQGNSLHAIKKYISEKYNINMTQQRYGIIKNCLREMLSVKKLRNVTGKGLVGHLKLVGRKQTVQQQRQPSQQRQQKTQKKTTKKKLQRPLEHDVELQGNQRAESEEQHMPSTHANSSQVITIESKGMPTTFLPLPPSQALDTSSPTATPLPAAELIENLTVAPFIIQNRQRVIAIDDLASETPRSSTDGSRRQLRKRRSSQKLFIDSSDDEELIAGRGNGVVNGFDGLQSPQKKTKN